MGKDIKWLKDKIKQQDIVMEKGYIRTGFLMYLIDKLDEPEVEEEQRYYALDSDDIPLLERAGNQIQRATTELSIYEKSRDNSRFKLTEQEIKGYDKRYWPFAEPVEQADFRLSF